MNVSSAFRVSSVKNFVVAFVCNAGHASCLRVCVLLFLSTMNTGEWAAREQQAERKYKIHQTRVYFITKFSPSITPGIRRFNVLNSFSREGLKQFIARWLCVISAFPGVNRRCVCISFHSNLRAFSNSSFRLLNFCRVEYVYFPLSWVVGVLWEEGMGRCAFPLWSPNRALYLWGKKKVKRLAQLLILTFYICNQINDATLNCLIALCLIADLMNCSWNEKSFWVLSTEEERERKLKALSWVDSSLIDFITHVIDANLRKL